MMHCDPVAVVAWDFHFGLADTPLDAELGEDFRSEEFVIVMPTSNASGIAQRGGLSVATATTRENPHSSLTHAHVSTRFVPP